ncbi:hypothetical protein SESBI_34914 [Sesbania bispinosa]|nr:hypothetical protein SESBI_34914 [Sesbania bispinosa]
MSSVKSRLARRLLPLRRPPYLFPSSSLPRLSSSSPLRLFAVPLPRPSSLSRSCSPPHRHRMQLLQERKGLVSIALAPFKCPR